MEKVYWMAKTSVPETRETTLDLLEAWAELIGTKIPKLDTDWSISDKDFIAKACELGNALEAKTRIDVSPDIGNPWVGFPNTPIGRLNAHLVGRVYGLRETLLLLARTVTSQ